MEQWQREAFDRLERAGYLDAMRQLAMSLCAPFWWYGVGPDGRNHILHNGTICYVNTGARTIGVTADHVYRQYLADKGRYEQFDCQFGASTIVPETRLIDRSEALDLATFHIPEVFVSAAGSSIHHPVEWPTAGIREREVVLFGGFPGLLRGERDTVADFPFQTFVTAATSVSAGNIVLHLDMPNLYWPLHEGQAINAELGGQSGGPVFRVIEGTPIDRLELVGFIYEYNTNLDVMLARPGRHVDGQGQIA